MIYYKIGNVAIRKKGVLAPMLEYTNNSFRDLCEYYDCGFLFSEMIHINQIINAEKLPKISKTPTAIQLVGDFRDRLNTFSAIDVIASKKKYKIIDFNFGCPSRKVISTKSGAFLLKHRAAAFEVIKEIKETTNFIVTVKTRLGYDKNEINKMSLELEKIGVDALSVHGRLASENYATKSDFDSVRSIKKNISCPLIYNGDVNSNNFESFLKFEEFFDLMIGRAALKDPQIFSKINCFVNGKEFFQKSKWDVIFDYLKFANKNKESISAQKLVLLQLSNGLPNAKIIKNKICMSKTIDDLLNILNK